VGGDGCFRSATTNALSTTRRTHPTDFYLPRAASVATVGGRAVMMRRREWEGGWAGDADTWWMLLLLLLLLLRAVLIG